MSKFSEIKSKRWVKIISNKYLLIVIIFIVWMLFFDTNSYLIHQELNSSIEKLENQKNTYQDEIKKDKVFIEKMKDSNQLEKFAREKYYLKKENEDIYIIEKQDSLKTKKDNE
ncbi:MAG: septum formation initiator family protein [Flavobacteriaceae bacterium]